MTTIDKRLSELGIELPIPAAPAANYVPYVLSGNMLFLAGQLPFRLSGELVKGRVGEGVSADEAISQDDAKAAAKLCGIQILAQAKAALGSLDRVVRVVKLGGFVNCMPTFTAHPAIINGASDLMVEVFGEKGKHARFAVGAPSLPLGAAVEIDAILEIHP